MGLLTKIIYFRVKLMSGSMNHTALHVIHRVITFSKSDIQLNYCSYRFSLEHLTSWPRRFCC